MIDYTDPYPTWLRRPDCRVVLVCGPPAGGKNTYVDSVLDENDVVVDLDECFLEACGVHGHVADATYLREALRLRNLKLSSLEDVSGVCYFICCAPTDGEKDFWKLLLGCDVVEVAPSLAEIQNRNVSDLRKYLAQVWFSEKALNDWVGPSVYRRSDGW